MDGSPKRSALLSALIHAVAILLILIVAASKHSPLSLLMPVRDTPVYLPPLRIHVHGFGGGGGQHSPLPPSKGHPPEPARRVFTPPIMVVQEIHPLIEMPPAILSTSDTKLPILNLPLGSAAGVTGFSSGGLGRGGGIGRGNGPGIGDGNGPGEGEGDGGYGSYGLHGKNATQPVALSRKDPEYSEEARKAKLQGTVELSIEPKNGG